MNMLRNIKFYLSALAILVGATSCLDKYPGSSIPEKEAMRTFADAEQTLTGIYASLKSNALYSGYLTLLPDIQADLVYAVEGNTNTYGSFWRWDIRPTDLQLEAVYAALYKVIGNCNFYLDRIDEVMANEISDTNIEKLEQYTGEVYAVRALCYTELLKTFCKAYEPDTAQSELGVVLRTKYFTPEAARRASLYDSYQFVLDDLAEAEKRLDKENDAYGNVYMTSASAEALHARVALYMQDWDTAIEYSSTLIDEKRPPSSSPMPRPTTPPTTPISTTCGRTTWDTRSSGASASPTPPTAGRSARCSSTSTRTTPISIPTMSPARPPWISTTMPTCAIRATSTRPRPVMPTG